MTTDRPPNIGAWVSCEEALPEQGRILCFSPVYPVGDPMRWRLMDAQFVRISKEVVWWSKVEENE